MKGKQEKTAIVAPWFDGEQPPEVAVALQAELAAGRGVEVLATTALPEPGGWQRDALPEDVLPLPGPATLRRFAADPGDDSLCAAMRARQADGQSLTRTQQATLLLQDLNSPRLYNFLRSRAANIRAWSACRKAARWPISPEKRLPKPKGNDPFGFSF